MPLYRFADVTVSLPILSPFAQEFFKEYRTAELPPDEEFDITEADFAQEAAFTPAASREICEITAVLRKLAEVLPTRYDGFMLHAATILYGDKAFAFVAPSGTGKTTHCRLWLDVLGDNARILNGDKLLVRKQNDRFVAYGNPWNGKEGYGQAGCYPLGGIFLLHRAEDNTVRRAAYDEALKALFAATATTKQSTSRLRVLELLDELLQRVNAYALYVNQTPDAVYTALGEAEGSV